MPTRKRKRSSRKKMMGGTSPVSLRLNFSWTLIGNIVAQVCMWGIISCYNKIGTSDAAGIYIIGLAIAQPVFHFTDFNLRQLYVTDVGNRWEFRDYLTHRLIWQCVGVLLCVVIGATLYWNTPSLILSACLLGLAVAGQSLSEMLHAFFQKHERFDTIAWSLMFRGYASLAAVGIVYLITRSVLTSLVVLVAARFFTVAVYDYPSACRFLNHKNLFRLPKQLTPRFRWETFARISWVGLPLAINMGLLSFVPQIPRFWLEKHDPVNGLAAAGQFGSIAMLMAVGLMVVNSLGVAMSQRFAKAFVAGKKREFRRLSVILVGGAFGLGCLGLLIIPFAGSWLLRVAYSDEYAGLTSLFLVIMFGATFGFAGNALGYPVTAAQHFRVQPLICLVQATITIIGCYCWVPGFGMFGAAWSVAMANIVHAALFAIVWWGAYQKMH